VGLYARARNAAKRLVLGPSDVSQQCTLGLRDPQQEIVVELHGVGAPRDVTHQHMLACAAPFAVAIAFESAVEVPADTPLSLHFRERGGSQQLLGKLGLRLSATIPADGRNVHCFTIRNCRNYCLAVTRLWAHYLHWAWLRWRERPDVRLSARDASAMPVFFICPRAVVLVSVVAGEVGNLFPMNLMGPLGNDLFGFALNSTRAAASLVEHAGRLAVSSVPVGRAAAARELGRNHKRKAIDWNDLPFPTRPSALLGLPVPCFSERVREMQVITTRSMGSHTLFLAKILHDERSATGLEYFMVHGVYQAWRQSARGSPEASRS